jgi:hypothetical protein
LAEDASWATYASWVASFGLRGPMDEGVEAGAEVVVVRDQLTSLLVGGRAERANTRRAAVWLARPLLGPPCNTQK